jgi:hypothetical protein
MCVPEESEQEHQRMLACAEGIYRRGLLSVMLLAGQDYHGRLLKHDIKLVSGQNEYKKFLQSVIVGFRLVVA